jgi:cellulose synthase/poly-beta-1,6-N-acetylglucosamine synthase-like glycosyltransferase
MESGDTLPAKKTVENLLKPFSNPKVGMTSTRPMPVDSPQTFLGFTTHLLWNLHHQVSLRRPKTGEMVAFRKVLKAIPPLIVDEAYIEGTIKKKGYAVVYVPEAVVYNKGPETVSDFLKQRRKIHSGHLYLREKTGYQVSTMDPLGLVSLAFKCFKLNFRNFFFLLGAALLELSARFLGWWDYKIKKKNRIIWEIAKSTKNLKS